MHSKKTFLRKPTSPSLGITTLLYITILEAFKVLQTVIVQTKPLDHAASLRRVYSSTILIFEEWFYSAVLQHTCQSCSSTDGQQPNIELIQHKTQMPNTPYLTRSVHLCHNFSSHYQKLLLMSVLFKISFCCCYWGYCICNWGYSRND